MKFKKVLALISATAIAAAAFAGCGDANAVEIKTADDLKTLKVGCQAGTTGETWLLENIETEPQGYKTGMDAALDLKNGKIDAVVLDELPAKSIVEANDDLQILDIKFAKEEYAIAVQKGNTELVEIINETITKMKDDGSYDALVEAFMPADGEIVIPEDLAPPAGGGSLKMGTNAAFKPFEYVEGTKVVGFDVTLCQYIAQEARAEIEVNDMAWESLLPALQSGNIDMIASGMSITEERLKNVDFSDPYYESEQVIIVKK